jgi:histidine triad (HIT) family protein
MEDCIFCKIVKGEIPCYKVYEDADFIAFLDIRPLTKGNTLVIPKKHYRWVYDVPNFGEYWLVAKKVSLAAIKSLNAERITFLTLGLEVSHAHIRVIPRYKKDLHGPVPDIDVFEKLTDSEMKEISDKMRSAI